MSKTLLISAVLISFIFLSGCNPSTYWESVTLYFPNSINGMRFDVPSLATKIEVDLYYKLPKGTNSYETEKQISLDYSLKQGDKSISQGTWDGKTRFDSSSLLQHTSPDILFYSQTITIDVPEPARRQNDAFTLILKTSTPHIGARVHHHIPISIVRRLSEWARATLTEKDMKSASIPSGKNGSTVKDILRLMQTTRYRSLPSPNSSHEFTPLKIARISTAVREHAPTYSQFRINPEINQIWKAEFPGKKQFVLCAISREQLDRSTKIELIQKSRAGDFALIQNSLSTGMNQWNFTTTEGIFEAHANHDVDIDVASTADKCFKKTERKTFLSIRRHNYTYKNYAFESLELSTGKQRNNINVPIRFNMFSHYPDFTLFIDYLDGSGKAVKTIRNDLKSNSNASKRVIRPWGLEHIYEFEPLYLIPPSQIERIRFRSNRLIFMDASIHAMNFIRDYDNEANRWVTIPLQSADSKKFEITGFDQEDQNRFKNFVYESVAPISLQTSETLFTEVAANQNGDQKNSLFHEIHEHSYAINSSEIEFFYLNRKAEPIPFKAKINDCSIVRNIPPGEGEFTIHSPQSSGTIQISDFSGVSLFARGIELQDSQPERRAMNRLFYFDLKQGDKVQFRIEKDVLKFAKGFSITTLTENISPFTIDVSHEGQYQARFTPYQQWAPQQQSIRFSERLPIEKSYQNVADFIDRNRPLFPTRPLFIPVDPENDGNQLFRIRLRDGKNVKIRVTVKSIGNPTIEEQPFQVIAQGGETRCAL